MVKNRHQLKIPTFAFDDQFALNVQRVGGELFSIRTTKNVYRTRLSVFRKILGKSALVAVFYIGASYASAYYAGYGRFRGTTLCLRFPGLCEEEE